MLAALCPKLAAHLCHSVHQTQKNLSASLVRCTILAALCPKLAAHLCHSVHQTHKSLSASFVFCTILAALCPILTAFCTILSLGALKLAPGSGYFKAE